MSVKTTNATISCLCGSVEQKQVTLSPVDTDIVFCHCTSCRHLTGQLFTSYVALDADPTSLDGLTKYHSDPDHPGLETTAYYFCSTCGCHVFQRSTYYSDDDDSIDDEDNNEKNKNSSDSTEKPEWAVATGVIICSPSENPDHKVRWQHQIVEDTKDWGLSLWLPTAFASTSDNSSSKTNNQNTTTKNLLPAIKVLPPPSSDTNDGGNDNNDQLLRAHCHCKRISFSISRPSIASTVPHRNYPDAMYSYAEEPSGVTSNPHDEKWWLRSPILSHDNESETPILKHTKYFAGTCVCRSCRLVSGFEIQCWAFVPRCNIHFDVDGAVNSKDGGLDFATIHQRDLLKTYQSSPGVWREFCPTCGSTVFYHAEKAKDVIDVSVGLFESSNGGARAEDWLEWGSERVSFCEEVRKGREGGMADWAERLLKGLEGGLKG
ncbi:Mss4-like protein [Sordaria brevicollis]|uniref:Mss4-like protein n=1 Tax=Sordaria brevicollis TaxID=83679 RepID=A0AAE0PAA1_SORBR|nr:Mss4-like protein [Sordaria brevicollis]